MELSVVSETVTVDIVPSAISLREHINNKVTASGREVSFELNNQETPYN